MASKKPGGVWEIGDLPLKVTGIEGNTDWCIETVLPLCFSLSMVEHRADQGVAPVRASVAAGDHAEGRAIERNAATF